MFLNSFNYFRAVAIIFIVAGHTFDWAGVHSDNAFSLFVRNIIIGGTALFVFISGFMFHHVFAKRYEYKRFMVGKLKNVFIPYFILGLLPVFLNVYTKDATYDGFYLPTGQGWFLEYLIPTLKYYWNGGFLLAYWYVPFILVTFCTSPLHMSFIRLETRWQLGIVAGLSVASMLLHRPENSLIVFHSVVYYLPVYLIGMLCSMHRDAIYRKLAGKEWLPLLGVAVFAGVQTYTGHSGNYGKDAFVYSGIDLMYGQKVFLCLFFMVLLHRFESFRSRILDTLAATSFAVFFLHPYIIAFGKRVFEHIGWADSGSWLVFAGLVLGMLLLCSCGALLLKKLIPSHSKYLTGY